MGRAMAGSLAKPVFRQKSIQWLGRSLCRSNETFCIITGSRGTGNPDLQASGRGGLPANQAGALGGIVPVAGEDVAVVEQGGVEMAGGRAQGKAVGILEVIQDVAVGHVPSSGLLSRLITASQPRR